MKSIKCYGFTIGIGICACILDINCIVSYLKIYLPKYNYVYIEISLYFLCELSILNINFSIFPQIETKVNENKLETLAFNIFEEYVEKEYPDIFN